MTEIEIKCIAEAIKGEVINATKEVLTFDEALKFMGLSKSFLYKLTSRREIPHYKPRGGMIYFSRHEIEKWLLSNRVCTKTELAEKANDYCKKGGEL